MPVGIDYSEAKAGEVQSGRPQLMARNGRVVLSELATHLNVNRSNLRKNLIKAGVSMELLPFPQVGNQKVLTLSEADAERYIAASDASPLSGKGVITYLE
jgi:hypothetical protein